MSLVSLVMRNLTVLALTGKTWAGNEVRSSLLVPINETQGEPAPMIAVFTDQAKGDDTHIEHNDILGARTMVTLAIEIACIARVPAQDGNGEETNIPETDEGMEMAIDIIHRQALAELQVGDSVWAKLWRDCRIKTRGLNVERGASTEKGVRFAAKRVELQMELLNDPTPGAPLTKFWTDVLAAFDAEPRMSSFASTLRPLVQGGTLPSWRQWQAEIGLTEAGIRGVGVAPFEGAELASNGEAALAVDITVEDHSGQEEELRAVDDGAGTLKRGNGAPVVLIEPTDG